MQEAHRIGDDFLQLEKFVNLNYMVRWWYGCECGSDGTAVAKTDLIGD